MLRKIMTAAVTVAVAVGTVVLVPAASAAENPPPGTIGHRSHNRYNSYIEIVGIDVNELGPDYLAKCGVDSPDQQCVISRTETVSREINAQFGASSGSVSAAIGISASQSVAIQIGCTSPRMNVREEYIAFPTETRYHYRVWTDEGAFVTDLGEYVTRDDWTASPVAYSAVYDRGFRCRVQQQP